MYSCGEDLNSIPIPAGFEPGAKGESSRQDTTLPRSKIFTVGVTESRTKTGVFGRSNRRTCMKHPYSEKSVNIPVMTFPLISTPALKRLLILGARRLLSSSQNIATMAHSLKRDCLFGGGE